MILHDDHGHSIAKTHWQQQAKQIAEWQIRHMVNRHDQATYWTADGWRASPGDVADRLRSNCSRLAPTVVYAHDADGLCKWACLDFDNHEESLELAEQNQQMAVGIINTLVELDIIAMLEDSDGQGGLHLWVIFSNAVPIEQAYRFAKWLRSDYPQADIECNPKQRTAKSWGNGVRLPGHHHKRNHISRFWGDSCWLDADESIELMINTPLNDPSVLDAMGDYDPDPKTPAVTRTALPFRKSSGRANSGQTLPEQAEEYLNAHFDWPTLLQHFGWTGGPNHWTRPGKQHGTSATLNYNGNGLLWVFSEASAVPVDGSGTKTGAGFGMFRFWLHHNGFTDSQQTEAARRLLQEVSR